MNDPKRHIPMPARVLLAVLAIGAVLALAGRSLAPQVPTATWLLWCAVVGCALAVVAVVGLVASLQLRQAVLRRGGTDVQWLAFSSEPEGLVWLRRAHRARNSHGE